MMPKVFDSTAQEAFARLSGDFNPLHIDPVAARRTSIGRPVVHGIHLLLWALDTALEAPSRILHLEAAFHAPIGVEEPVSCCVLSRDDQHLKLSIQSYGAERAVVSALLATSQGAEGCSTGPAPELQPCRELEPHDIANAHGTLDVGLDPAKAKDLFPGLVGKLPAQQIALLLATTRLVGMKCPGLRSIYSELTFDFTASFENHAHWLEWSVSKFDSRFSRASIAVRGPGVEGTIVAFLRPAPARQPAAAEISGRVPPGAFSGQKALVIGGSRGLGEVCAKLLGAGGADVLLTYSVGTSDATRVVAEIRTIGGRAATQAFDVLLPPKNDSAPLEAGWLPTHVYYFATPAIFVSAKGVFSDEIFQKFCSYYVAGFEKTCRWLSKMTQGRLIVLFPSSVAVEEIPPNMAEYAAAKAAGEAVCRFLQATHPGLSIRIERLPRLLTDQTTSLQKVAVADSVEVLKKVLLSM